LPKFVKPPSEPKEEAKTKAVPPVTTASNSSPAPSQGLSAYEVQRLDTIAKNHAHLARLGIEEAKTACRTEKKAPRKRKLDRSTPQPARNSRRLAGEAAVDVFVEDEEGRKLTLGGDVEEVANMNAEQRVLKEAQRAEAWEAARAHVASSAASAEPPALGSSPERGEFVSLDTPLFHLNTFIVSEAKENRAFGLFLSEGIATPGFRRASESTLERVQQQWPLDEAFRPALRDLLIEDYGPSHKSSATQRATWLTACRPGAYIVCRHAYDTDLHMPTALKGVDGSYLGAVYAIGRVVSFPPPQSSEDEALVAHIPEQRLERLDMERYYMHAVAKVDFFALGYLDDLSPQTMGYINQVCQPTLNQMLKGGDGKRDYHSRVRRELWDKATVQISAGMFSDDSTSAVVVD